MRRRLLPSLCVLLFLGANGCGMDEAVAPSTSTTSQGAAKDVSAAARPSSQTDTVVALARSVPLANDVHAFATIGPEGGAIEIQGTGGRIIFPPGALRESKQIKMTAKAGANVAYEFCPHGLTFDVPVVIEQDLTYTAVGGMKVIRTLQAGYYAQALDAILLGRGQSLARVSEVRDATVDRPLSPHLARFYIFHFSGYIMSSGFAPGSGGDDGGSDTSAQP